MLLNNLGFLYYAMGRYDEALPWLQKTLLRSIQSAAKRRTVNIAELSLQDGPEAEAKQHYQSCLRLSAN